jgi:hypothetical protein
MYVTPAAESSPVPNVDVFSNKASITICFEEGVPESLQMYIRDCLASNYIYRKITEQTMSSMIQSMKGEMHDLVHLGLLKRDVRGGWFFDVGRM